MDIELSAQTLNRFLSHNVFYMTGNILSNKRFEENI